MSKKVLNLLGVVALAIAVAIFVAPSASHAVTITSVEVTVGTSNTFCGAITAAFPCSPGNAVWNLGAIGVVLAPGQSLILAQTNGYNFDSEGCTPTTPCLTTVKINGVTVVNNAVNSILANGNQDTGGSAHNEASNYFLAAHVPNSYDLFFGYADNVHTDPCADTTGGTTNCQPDPFGGPFAVGTAVPAGSVEPADGIHCTVAQANCFDSGVLFIVAAPEQQVPEASTLLLLGTGLMGVAAWSRRRLQGKN